MGRVSTLKIMKKLTFVAALCGGLITLALTGCGGSSSGIGDAVDTSSGLKILKAKSLPAGAMYDSYDGGSIVTTDGTNVTWTPQNGHAPVTVPYGGDGTGWVNSTNGGILLVHKSNMGDEVLVRPDGSAVPVPSGSYATSGGFNSYFIVDTAGKTTIVYADGSTMDPGVPTNGYVITAEGNRVWYSLDSSMRGTGISAPAVTARGYEATLQRQLGIISAFASRVDAARSRGGGVPNYVVKMHVIGTSPSSDVELEGPSHDIIATQPQFGDSNGNMHGVVTTTNGVTYYAKWSSSGKMSIHGVLKAFPYLTGFDPATKAITLNMWSSLAGTSESFLGKVLDDGSIKARPASAYAVGPNLTGASFSLLPGNHVSAVTFGTSGSSTEILDY
jgi:hypothetical protein